MYFYEIDGIQVQANEEMEDPEIAAYAQRCLGKYGTRLKRIRLDFEGEEVEIRCYERCDQGFERIRRITGYLVGTLDRFNDAKAAEVHDRVIHGI